MPPSTELHTNRLLLRGYRKEDVPALVRLLGAREVAATTLRIPHPYTTQDAHSFLHQIKQDPALTRFAMCLAATGELCGGIGLNLDEAHSHAELGYWMGVPYWGQGYCSEAAREVVRYGFENLGLHRIFAACFAGNPASQRVLQKLGMKYEGCLRQHIKKWDRYVDLEHYGLLVDEWRSTQR